MQESQTCSSFYVTPRHQGHQCFLAQKVPPASQPHLTSWWAAKPPRAPRSTAWAGPQQPVTRRVVGQRLHQVGLDWEASYHSTERLGRDRGTPVCVWEGWTAAKGPAHKRGTEREKQGPERCREVRQGRAERERRQEQGSESEGE